MAGVGFVLRDLVRRDRLAAPTVRLGHGAIVAAGPWIFTVLSIAVIHRATAQTLSPTDSYAFRGLVIYAFALSLVATAPVVNVAVRQVADDIFLGNFHEVRPRYVAALILSALASALAAAAVLAVVLGVTGPDLVVGIAATAVVGLIWPTLAFCGAVRDHSGITAGFVLGLLASVMATVWAAHAGWGPTAMMAAFTAGLGIVFFGLATRVLASFPHPVTRLAPQIMHLLHGFARYWVLALGSITAIVALWIDKWIMWFGPQGVALSNGLISAPAYDGAMFVAYLSIIPALALFVTAMDSDFYEAYRAYFLAIRDRGPLARIQRAGAALKRQSNRVLGGTFVAQAILCAAVAAMAPALVSGVGLQYQQIGILRFGVLAALLQFLFLACNAILLFFDRHGRFLALQALFLVCQTGFTLLTLQLGPEYYGFGHLAACATAGLAAVVVLDRTFRKLDYLTFASALRQSLANRDRRPARPLAETRAGDETIRPAIPPRLDGGRPRPLLAP